MYAKILDLVSRFLQLIHHDRFREPHQGRFCGVLYYFNQSDIPRDVWQAKRNCGFSTFQNCHDMCQRNFSSGAPEAKKILYLAYDHWMILAPTKFTRGLHDISEF